MLTTIQEPKETAELKTAADPKTPEKPAPLRQQSPSLKLFRPPEPAAQNALRFTPYAWAKLHFFCHFGDTEIGAFGVANPKALLLVEDIVLVKQQVSAVTVNFDDEAVADFFEAQVDQGRKPEAFARIWCHTHPGNSPTPSGTDEETLARVFGKCDWAVMFILARSGKSFARLRFNVGPGGGMVIPVAVDYDLSFPSSALETWAVEYEKCIALQSYADLGPGLPQGSGSLDLLGDSPDWPFPFAPEDSALFMEGGLDA